MRRQILIVALFVLALRLPFLNQAIQGDDVYYLYGAEHAQIDPLHPNHARYAFLGRIVDMRGHPHPPFNAWFLAALLWALGNVREIPFHAAYILFSLIAALSALALARRFTTRPLSATLLFLVTPAFVVNGNSLESDLPFLAFWLLSAALFVRAVDRRSIALLIAASGAMLFCALSAYQAVILAPILLIYGRKWRVSWIAALTAPVALIVWQVFERASTGAMPAAVLAGYMQTYGLQAFEQKLRNAVALTGHLAWVVFPALWIPTLWMLPIAAGAALLDANPLFWGSIAVGTGILIWLLRQWRDFLAQWILVFFASALVIFFAGSARYLLPIAAPLAILTAVRVGRRWLYAGIACELALSLSLAIVNYQHWNGYREFARTLDHEAASKRVWINGEWGLRYYFESEGALPLLLGQAVQPGEIVVSSALAYPLKFTTGGGVLAPLASREISSRIPLRLVALNGKSAYSATLGGLRPFDISTGPIDRIIAESVIERQPTLSILPMNSPEAEQQILSGVYALENGQWRWIAGQAVFLLKAPAPQARIEASFFIPDQAPARRVTLSVDGRTAAEQTYEKPGAYTLASQPLRLAGNAATVVLAVDKTFSAPGDQRRLGIILTSIALR